MLLCGCYVVAMWLLSGCYVPLRSSSDVSVMVGRLENSEQQ